MGQRPEKSFTDAACQPFSFPGDEHGVLLIHGFTGSASHMRPLGERLNAAGFTVEGVNLPGHAASMEEMGKTGWQDWLEAAKTAFFRLQQRCRYASVAGLSMGGCLTLLLAEQMHPTAIAPISAPMAVQNRLLPLAGLMKGLIPHISWQERDETAYPLDDRYDYGYTGFPTKCAADLHHIIKMARQDLHAVTCPILAVQSSGDETIDHRSIDIILDGVSSEVKGALRLKDVPHVCTISDALPAIADGVAETFRAAQEAASRQK